MKRTIPFSRVGLIGLILSFCVTLTLVALTFFYRGEFNLGIDFRSGQTIDIEITESTTEQELEALLTPSFPQGQVARLGNTENSFNLKVPSEITTQESDLQKVIEVLEGSFSGVSVLSTSFIGAGISQNLLRSVLLLTAGALALILLYIWMRFKIQFAVSAIVALLHDTLFIVGIIGVFQFEITVSTIAAILTIIGYSLNDTIVIFDRIRENMLLVREGSFKTITDKSINQTLSRTVITSLTTLLAVGALVWFALGDVYNFARTLAIGILAGTWSSLFVATPMVHLLGGKKMLETYRQKKGLSIQYSISQDNAQDSSVSSSIKTSSPQTISQKELDRIKQEVRTKQTKHKHKKK